MKRIASLIGSTALLLTAVAAGCAPAATSGTGAPSATVNPSDPAVIAEGRRLFQGNGRCGICHGATGAGGRSGPSLADDRWIWVQPNSASFVADIANIIRVGVPTPREFQAPMPPMGGGQLTETEIQTIAAYVASL